MARRNSVLDFIKNFNLTYDTVGRVGQDFEMAKVGAAKPVQSEGFTAEQGDQLRAAAESGQYDVAYDEAKGGYTVTPKADPSQVGVIAKQGVTDFMGERTAGALNDGQVNDARMKAMAGVLMKTDPAQGMRMMREVTQGQRDDQRFGWEKARNERELAKAAQADDDEALMRSVDAEAGEWHTGRLKNPDGTARAANVDDFLATTQFKAFKLASAGKLGEASQAFKDYAAQSLVKIQLQSEQRNQALGLTASALAAGDLDAVKDFYNEFIPDGAKVTDVKRGANGQISIERETLDGRKLAPTVMKDTGQLVSALATLKDPMAIYNYSQNEFRNNLAIRADQRAGSAEARAGRAEGRAAAEFASEAPQRQLKSTLATLQLGLGNAETPEQRADIQGKLTAIQSGLAGTTKDQPAEVKLAQAMLQAGMATDMRSALEMAITRKGQSADEMHREFVQAGIKNMAKPEDAVKSANEVMQSMGFSKSGNRWSQGTPAAAAPAVPPAGQRKVGQVYDTPRGKMVWRGEGWEAAQ